MYGRSASASGRTSLSVPGHQHEPFDSHNNLHRESYRLVQVQHIVQHRAPHTADSVDTVTVQIGMPAPTAEALVGLGRTCSERSPSPLESTMV